MAQAHQAYYSMNIQTLEPLLMSAWREHCNMRGTQAQTWIAFYTQWTKAKYAAESAEVKEEVEEFRKTYDQYKDPNESQELRNRRYHG